MRFTTTGFQKRVSDTTKLYTGSNTTGFALAAIGTLVEVIGNRLEAVIHSSDSDEQRYKSSIEDLLHDDVRLIDFMDDVVEKLNDSKSELHQGRHYGLIVRNAVNEALEDMLSA